MEAAEFQFNKKYDIQEHNDSNTNSCELFKIL